MPAKFNVNKSTVVFMQGRRNKYKEGALSIDKARSKFNEHSSGIQRFDWDQSDFAIPGELKETGYQGKHADGSLFRQGSEP